MKKITIAMEDNTQEWLRAQAAREHISVSHCLRNLVDQARARDASSELPFKKFKRQPGSLKGQIWLADDWDSPETNRMINDMMLPSRIFPDEPDPRTIKEPAATRVVASKKRTAKPSPKRKP